jgi:hypothetical protein
MSAYRYRLAITGQLAPGVSPVAAAEAMSRLFEGPPSLFRPLFDGSEHAFSGFYTADQAIELQALLQATGIESRIENVSPRGVELVRRRGAAAEPTAAGAQAGTLVVCPSCATRQIPSARCVACGLALPAARAPAVPREAPAAARPAPAAGRATARPARPAVESGGGDDAPAPSEDVLLSHFVGPRAPHYIAAYHRLKAGPRFRFAPTWNWAALPWPFLWALHRKLWLVAPIAFVSAVVIPLTLVVLGRAGVAPGAAAWAGVALWLANAAAWPVVADFLYLRQARQIIDRIRDGVPEFSLEMDLATAGGVSGAATLGGVAVMVVFSLFLWTGADALRQHQASSLAFTPHADLRPDAATRPAPTTQTPGEPTQTPQGTTRTRLRALAQAVTAWSRQRGGRADAFLVDLPRVQRDLQLPAEQLVDGWGTPIEYVPMPGRFRLVSAGPDGVRGTADDSSVEQALE